MPIKTKRLLVATGNQGKLREIKAILTDYEVLGAKEMGLPFDVEETGVNFSENAFIKANALRALTDCAVLADDSGLCVDVLGGAPGIYSARYAGENATDEDNVEKLLTALQDTPDENRTARFVSSVCLITEDGDVLYGEGLCEGLILREPKGNGGFGYDPVFYSLDFNESFGILTPEQKNAVSHRKRALEDLKKQLI
ncbi:MAG: RdgB/HAM1 family non-canonical purine NTP pyrophosphatase [Ruminococcaceae bacterium]|nr:RdgB/HAM1 family non-canonical purine NTP pyrophosphatase [Oscillospiraceae bacterium]